MSIADSEIETARKTWGDSLIEISKAYDEHGIDAARALAEKVLDSTYGYNLGPVLFKPTLSGGEFTFRTTKQGALSYFVGHDKNYPDDAGFGLKSWRKVTSKTAATFVEADLGIWMGNFHFTNSNDEVTTVDKTFGYKKGADGALLIVLHHSSLPYQKPS